MNYINFLASLYIGIAMIGCNAAQVGDKSVGEQQEISPRDQDQQSPRRITFLGKSIDLRKAIANSSPRRVESPRKNSSRDGIEKFSGSISKDSSPRELESPRTLIRSKSTLSPFAQEKDNKNLRSVLEIEKAGSPRGEELVVGMLRAGSFDRRKSAPNLVVDFQKSSPPVSHLFGDDSKSSITDKHEDKKFPKPLSVEDQRLLQSGLIVACSKNKEQWQQDFNKTLKELVTSHKEREVAKLPKELQKEQEEA